MEPLAHLKKKNLFDRYQCPVTGDVLRNANGVSILR